MFIQINEVRKKFKDDKRIKFCGCGNELITDKELDLKVCRECY